MLKDITLGQYFPGNTLIHRLDPRTKLLCVILYIVALFLAKFFLTYAILFLVLAGAVGNLIDRTLRGFVVDMFNVLFMNFAVFNVADICIVSGAVLGAVYYLWFYEKYDGKGARNGNADADRRS